MIVLPPVEIRVAERIDSMRIATSQIENFEVLNAFFPLLQANKCHADTDVEFEFIKIRHRGRFCHNLVQILEMLPRILVPFLWTNNN